MREIGTEPKRLKTITFCIDTVLVYLYRYKSHCSTTAGRIIVPRTPKFEQITVLSGGGSQRDHACEIRSSDYGAVISVCWK